MYVYKLIPTTSTSEAGPISSTSGAGPTSSTESSTSRSLKVAISINFDLSRLNIEEINKFGNTLIDVL